MNIIKELNENNKGATDGSSNRQKVQSTGADDLIANIPADSI